MNERSDAQVLILRRLRAQTWMRIAFVVFIIVWVYAQSYQGRVFLNEELIKGCERGQRAYHALHLTRNYVDCNMAYPAPSPLPWK